MDRGSLPLATMALSGCGTPRPDERCGRSAIRIPMGTIHQVLFSPSGRHLLTVNGNGSAYVLRLSQANGQEPKKTDGAAGPVRAAPGLVAKSAVQPSNQPLRLDSAPAKRVEANYLLEIHGPQLAARECALEKTVNDPSLLSGKLDQLSHKDNSSHDCGADGGGQHGTGGDVEGLFAVGVFFDLDHAAKDFKGTVEKFGGDDRGDAAEQDTPLDQVHSQSGGCGDDDRGDEEMYEET